MELNKNVITEDISISTFILSDNCNTYINKTTSIPGILLVQTKQNNFESKPRKKFRFLIKIWRF